jgi:hypothetical protein
VARASRTIVQPALHGGDPCPDLEKSESCNSEPCPQAHFVPCGACLELKPGGFHGFNLAPADADQLEALDMEALGGKVGDDIDPKDEFCRQTIQYLQWGELFLVVDDATLNTDPRLDGLRQQQYKNLPNIDAVDLGIGQNWYLGWPHSASWLEAVPFVKDYGSQEELVQCIQESLNMGEQASLQS